ncbi:hypothetical protein [Leclercia adecarboxylata]|uniref:hypothetical protein n=1 Tax=Leclercia adecarboxylata TaxID=83655 RepID=UPI003D2D027A
MTTISTLTYPQSDEQIIPASLTTPLSAAADLFEVADRCAALVSVLIETDDRTSRIALCEGLLHALRLLRERCDAELPPHLIAQLIQGETLNPVCRNAGKKPLPRWTMRWLWRRQFWVERCPQVSRKNWRGCCTIWFGC